MTFENTVARYRKCVEQRDELKDIVDALNGECETLEASIIDACMNDPSLFNVFKRKTSSAGLVGRNYFQVSFSKSLMRRGATDRLDDQEWLAGLDQQYVREKKMLSASKVKADYAEGTLTDAALRDMDLVYGDKVSVTAKHIPDDAELAAIKQQANALVGESE